VRILGGRTERELVQVRLSDDAPSGCLERGDRGCSLRRDMLAEQRRSVRRHEPGRVEQILDGERASFGLGVRERQEHAWRAIPRFQLIELEIQHRDDRRAGKEEPEEAEERPAEAEVLALELSVVHRITGSSAAAAKRSAR
jgi:hypothetical protein